MRKKTKNRKKSTRIIVILAAAVVIAAAVVLGLYHFGVIGKGSMAADLSAALEQWTDEWRNGDKSALSEGMIFGVSDQDEAVPADEEEDGALSAEELKAIMEEQYSELIEPPAEPETTDSVFPILMKYTSVSYKLPPNVEEGQAVTFEITGPDMAKIIANLNESANQEELFSELEAILASGSYEQRTVSAQAEIEALDDGYRLRNSYALIDGLYGGLLSVVSDALPEAE